jgi:GT2 family glycosyltransferase
MKTDAIVSIVVPTFNRLALLQRCLDKIAKNVDCGHEVIVVEGGSTDGSREWLSHRSGVRVILEEQKQGAVHAFNLGFRAASTPYVMWLNDDAYPLPGAVEAALSMIQHPEMDDVGMIAFYHTWDNDRNILDEVTHEGQRYVMCHVRGYPYANFGLLRADLLARLGYADEGYYYFGFDPDLSLKIQLDEGLKVLGCRDALVHHDQHHDKRKMADLPSGKRDNDRLFNKWGLPDPGCYPDPGPGYRAMIESRLNRRGSRKGRRRKTHPISQECRPSR